MATKKISTPKEIIPAKPEDLVTEEDFLKAKQAATEKIRASVITAIQETNVDSLIADHIKQLKIEIQEVANALLGIDTRWSQPSIEEKGLLSSFVREDIKKQLEIEYLPVVAPMVTEHLDKYINSSMFQKHIRHCVKEAFERSIYGYEGIQKMIQQRVANEATQIMNSIITP
jgi:hypothetical protein